MAVVLQGRTARRLVWATVAAIVLFTVILYALLVTGPTYMAVKEMRNYSEVLLRQRSMAGFDLCGTVEQCIHDPIQEKARELRITLAPEDIRWDGKTLVLDYERTVDFLFFRYDWPVHEEIRMAEVWPEE
jgi:hypothetical protein